MEPFQNDPTKPTPTKVGTAPVLDQDRQRQAQIYARIQRRLWAFDLIFGLVYLLIWLLTGLSKRLSSSLYTFASSQWSLVLLFTAILGGIYYMLDLPLSLYAGFVLPHRFNLSNQNLKGWIADQLKGLLISVPVAILLIEIIYWVLRIAPQTWWFWAALILVIFNVLLANLAPVVIAPLFYKFEPLQETQPVLAENLMKLAEKANTRVRGVYKFDMSRRTKTANAALYGLGNTRRIIIGDTLINEFSPDEIETVLAHELGHQIHNDVPILILFGSLVVFLGLFLSSICLNWGVAHFGFSGPGDVAAMPLIGLVLGFYGLFTTPLENSFSRWRESLADDYALKVTGKGKAYAAALTRLANQNLADVDPEAWVVFLLHSHPALNKRIQRALETDSIHG